MHEMQPRELIGDRSAEEQRRIVAAPGEPHRAGQRLHQVILARARGVGAGAPVARRRRVDQPRVALVQRLVSQARAVHHARTEILDHDIRLLDQLEDPLEVRGILEVDLDAALVAVEGEERVGLTVRARGKDAPLPHPFAVLLLELDDVGTEVAQDLRRERALQQRREIEHADPGERPRCGGGVPVRRCLDVHAATPSRPQPSSQRSANASISARQSDADPLADQR